MQRTIVPGVSLWSAWQPDRNVFFNSHFIRTPEGNLLIDPLPLTAEDTAEIEAAGGVAWVILTNRDHQRDAASAARRFGARIAASAPDCTELSVAVDCVLQDGDTLLGLRTIALDGLKTAGEFALALPDRATVLVGDALWGDPAGSLRLLPNEKLLDPARAARSLRKLLALRPRHLLVGDGAALFHTASESIAASLETRGDGFQAAIFDLDDTLHDDTDAYHRAARQAAEEIAREHGIDAATLHRAYIRESESFWQNLTQEHLAASLLGVRERMWLAALRTVGIDDIPLAQRAADSYNRHRKGFMRLFPGALELLSALRSRGIKLALLTNGFAETHREKIELLGLSEAFDEVFIADEVGMVKPDPRIFLHACERLNAAPSHTAMVGDRFDRDVSGAQAAGLFSVWFNVRRETIPAGAQSPDAIVEDIETLSAVL